MSASSSATAAPLAHASGLDASILQNAHRADLTAEEYFDVLRPDGSHTGQTKLRKLVHRDGDWHAAVHIWLIHSETGQVLLQKRAACKDSFPSCWDVSCAGHLSAGETVASATEAELAEELGILKPQDRTFKEFFRELPTMPREVISQGGKFIDREHTSIFIVEGNWKEQDMTLQAEEVEEVKWMDLEDIMSNMEKKAPGYVAVPDWETYRKHVFDPLVARSKEIQEKNAKK